MNGEIMRNYILKRVFLIFITAAIIIFLVFIFIKMLPNYHQAVLGVDPELRKLLEELEGYNKPILEQFWIWVQNIFRHGSLGRSLNRRRDVTAILADRILVSMRLNILPYMLAIPSGLGFGIWAALKKNKMTDHIISVGVVIFIS